MADRISDSYIRDHAGPLAAGFDNHVFEVASGTEIEGDGEILTVTETAIVWIGNRVYCTARVFNQIHALSKRRAH